MIVDGFTFYNELDVLEIRLEELFPVVDRFVIVEANKTFRGNAKPWYFMDSIERYDRYLSKIVRVEVDMDDVVLPTNVFEQSWSREYFQRNAITQGIQGCQGNDIILISDVDEIPRRSVVANVDVSDGPVSIMVDRFIYGTNMRSGEQNTVKALYYKDMTTPQEIRMTPPDIMIEHAGWEFTSVGSPEFIANKLKNYSHMELDLPQYTDADKIRDRINRGVDLFDRYDGMFKVEIDDTWPEAIKNNRERYKHLEC